MTTPLIPTTIWTAWNTSRTGSILAESDGRPRCIWRGNLPHLFRKGDMIQVLEGYCVETVDRVYYSIPDGSQEIHLTTSDRNHEYPTVPYSDKAEAAQAAQ